MNTLFIMVGAPGSGKSYFANVLSSNISAKIISRDKIRFNLLEENDEYFHREGAVFIEFIETIQNYLDAGETVIADATHLTKKSRSKLLNNLNIDNVYVIPVVIKTSLKTCLMRNSIRQGREKVPETVLRNMYKSMTDPIDDHAALKNKYYDVLYISGEV